jgi:hypothetical protein
MDDRFVEHMMSTPGLMVDLLLAAREPWFRKSIIDLLLHSIRLLSSVDLPMPASAAVDTVPAIPVPSTPSGLAVVIGEPGASTPMATAAAAAGTASHDLFSPSSTSSTQSFTPVSGRPSTPVVWTGSLPSEWQKSIANRYLIAHLALWDELPKNWYSIIPYHI